MPNEIAVLTEIATDLLLNELKRRAVVKGMTTEELLAEAKDQWNDAATEAEKLANKGHE